MTLLHSTETPEERAARLMTEAMRRDMEGQRELIHARARGETDAVYWEEHRFREQVQCTLIRIHLASEGIRKEIERSRVLLGLN